MASSEVEKSRGKDRSEADPPDIAHAFDPACTPSAIGPVHANAEAKDPHDEDKIGGITMVSSEEEKKRLGFLDLPPEVRNKIYRQYVGLISWTRFGYGRSLFQPALAIASKQVRAEFLPVFYGRNAFFLLVHTDSPQQWTDSVRRTISSFNVDSNGSPESSSLRHLEVLNLLLKADKRSIPPVEIKIEMTSYNWSQGTGYAGVGEYEPVYDGLDDPLSRWYNLKSRVRIGSSDLDWTNDQTQQIAFDKAAGRLRDILAEMEAMLDFEMSSTPRDHRTALDVIRIVETACPQLAKTVFIRDNTEPARTTRYRADLARLYSRERY